MSTIRLTITPEIRQVLEALKSKYPPLTEPEILKVALSELYVKTSQREEKSSVNIKELTGKGRKYFKEWLKGKGKDISTISEDEAYNLIKNA